MTVAARRRARRTWSAGRIGAALVAVALGVGCSATDADTAEGDADDISVSTLAKEDVTGSSAPDEAEPATPEPLVTAEPDQYSEVGDLVEGFPIDLLPVPADAVILVTSAVPVGDADVQEVSLNLRTSATAANLLGLYRDTLTAEGFT